MGADGTMLENAALCLDGSSSNHLTFLSSASTAWNLARLRARQVLVSEEAYPFLSSRFPKLALVAAKFMRPMVMGNLELELLPSGESPGSSFLMVRKGIRSLLYVSHWSPEKDPHVRQMIVKEAPRIFWRPVGDPLAPAASSRAEWERFLAWLQNGDDRPPHVLVNPVRDLPRLLPALSQAGIAFTLDDFSQEIFNSRKDLFETTRTDGTTEARTCLRIFSRPSLAALKKSLPKEGRWASSLLRNVDDQGFTLPGDVEIEAHFRFLATPGVADFCKLASAAGAREVIVSAPSGIVEPLVSALQNHRLTTWVLAAPRTDTLF